MMGCAKVAMWREGVAPGLGLRMVLDCGFRQNDECLGAIHRAQAQKAYAC